MQDTGGQATIVVLKLHFAILFRPMLFPQTKQNKALPMAQVTMRADEVSGSITRNVTHSDYSIAPSVAPRPDWRNSTLTTYGATLTPAAAAAIQVEPTEILHRWFAGLSPAARMKYGQALRLFVTWSTGAADPSPEDALRLLVDAGRVGARQLVIGWRDSMLEAGRASGTVAGLCSALASLVTACRLCGLVEWHLEKIAPRVEQRHDRSGPPRHAVEHLLDVIDRAAADGDLFAVRDRAIVRLLHNSALRRFEVTGLRLCDVQIGHADGPRVLALRKGKRERQPMTIGKLCAESLRAWLAVRGTDDPAAPCFVRVRAPGAGPGPLSGEAVRLLLASWAKRAGLRGPCRPHGLRHASATHAARNGSLAGLKALGGWSTLSSPARYLDDAGRDRDQAVQMVEV